MSIWDQIKEIGSNAIEDAKPAAQQHISDYLTDQLARTLGQNQQINEPVNQTLPAPAQILAQTPGFIQRNLFYFAAAAAAVVAFFAFRRKGKK